MLKYLSDRLYHQVRGQGLTYSISMALSVSTGRVHLSLSKSSQLTGAYKVVRDIFRNYTQVKFCYEFQNYISNIFIRASLIGMSLWQNHPRELWSIHGLRKKKLFLGWSQRPIRHILEGLTLSTTDNLQRVLLMWMWNRSRRLDKSKNEIIWGYEGSPKIILGYCLSSWTMRRHRQLWYVIVEELELLLKTWRRCLA